MVILLSSVLSIDLQLGKTVYRVICRGLIKNYAIAPCILSGTQNNSNNSHFKSLQNKCKEKYCGFLITKKRVIRKEKDSCITWFLLVLLVLFKWLNLCHCVCANKTYSEKDTECNVLFLLLFLLLIMLLCTPSPQANKTDLWKC